MKIEKISAKSLIRTSNRSPHHIHLNIYQGCFHNCAYCNGISDNYHMHDDFDNIIKAKINAPELFEQFLIRRGYKPINRNGTTTLEDFLTDGNETPPKNNQPDFLLSLFGNVCDIYQPAEEEMLLTRQLLQVVHDYCVPIRILTKSSLVLRDLDLIKKINEKSFARVAFTITLMNEEDQTNFEPMASSSLERIRALNKFREEGIPSGAYITPVIPFIGDTDENLNSIFTELKSANSEFVITGGLTLKPGRNKEHFMQIIQNKYPSLYSSYNKLYSNNNPFGQPDPEKAQEFQLTKPVLRGYQLAKEYGINFFEPRYIPNVGFRRNLVIATYLSRIGFLMNEILGENRTSAYEYRKAGSELEHLNSDITTMTDSKLEDLNLSLEIIKTIREIVDTGKCSYFQEKGDFGSLFV